MIELMEEYIEDINPCEIQPGRYIETLSQRDFRVRKTQTIS